ncbi:transposase IS204/IS1001/IS1096/IS1165 family protein [Methylobacterium nodulans ORS 2060]|nr:transposase IS204/IS1001/IS1096/IS1165 family protein [Methylobacterium nodulans ORS 2060]ACL58039.1 transposase IS204/IS1001/IS1096/IS1165 family protein [Methylobacterium nodulans ORS 2060]ACL59468.1 transposase IS204/IS1001/IS1096/IS1165 family protein [Methylobacterium nodulans ORS 2060]
MGQPVTLRLRIRRFYCHHPACRRRTFAEPLPRLIPPRARRTRRLAQAQTRIGLAVGGEAGARLTGHLGMQTSPDTILRLVHRLPLPRANAPRAVGIDDWAIRKGRSYGTLLVDLERRCPIDLLPDRSGATVAAWLRRHPSIQIVARDRSTEYARAATAGAPAALQVADRWHLLLNLRQVLERWLGRVHGRLRQLPPLASGDGRQPGERPRAYRRSAAEIAVSLDSRARRLAAYEDVRRRHLAGETLLAIGRATGLARATVRKYAQAESFPERAIRRPNPSRLDPYLAHLEQRMAEGCENAMALWREIRRQGFAGTHRQVHRFVAERRTARKWLSQPASTSTEAIRPSPIASPKQLAWILVQPLATLQPRAAADLARIRQDPEAARIADLARRFTMLVRACGLGGDRPADPASELDRWLLETRNCGVAALETFAAGLAQDGAAVRAALTTSWSNAQAEGQISRLKMLKRTMYGRASFALLRSRILIAA